MRILQDYPQPAIGDGGTSIEGQGRTLGSREFAVSVSRCHVFEIKAFGEKLDVLNVAFVL